MIALGFHEPVIKPGEFRIHRTQRPRQDLKLLAASAFNQRTADQMINYLVTLATADGPHEACDPGTRLRLPEWNSPCVQQSQYKLKMLKLLDGDCVQLIHPAIKV